MESSKDNLLDSVKIVYYVSGRKLALAEYSVLIYFNL